MKRLEGHIPLRGAIQFLHDLAPRRNWRSYLLHNRSGRTEAPVISFRRYQGEVFYRERDLIDHLQKWHAMPKRAFRFRLKAAIERVVGKAMALLKTMPRMAASLH